MTTNEDEKKERDQFGKDNNGNYLDQKAFVRSRNELNEEEEKHQDMFKNKNLNYSPFSLLEEFVKTLRTRCGKTFYFSGKIC